MALSDRQAAGDPARDPVLDRLYGAGPREEPPPGIDAAVLAAAHREVGARPRPLGSAMRRWRLPVSIAAVVVLSASLVMLMKEEGGDRFYEGPSAASEPAPIGPASSDVARPQNGPARQSQPTPRAEGQAQPAAPSTAAGPSKQETTGERRDMSRQVESLLAKVQPPAVPPSAPAEESRPAAESARAPDRAAAPFPAVPEAKVLSRAEVAAKKTDEPETRMRDSAERSRSSEGAAGSLAAPAAVPPAKAPAPARNQAASPQAAADAATQRAPVWSGFERQPPEKWIEHIEELRRTGRAAEARDMLGEFRRRFPDYPLPASLSR